MKALLRWNTCLLALLVAIGQGACRSAPPAGGGGDATGNTTLARAGLAVRRVHPGDEVPLQVVVSEPGVGPAQSSVVEWHLLADPGGTRLSSRLAATDAAGQATTTVTPTSTGDVVIEASSPGVEGKAAWKLEVRPLVRMLRIVPGAGVRLKGQDAANAGDPTEATVAAGKGRNISLRVKVLEETEDVARTVSGQAVTFTLLGGLTGTRMLDDGPLHTRADGTVDGRLVVGSVSGAYVVEAALDGGSRVTFNVAVSDVAGTLPTDPGDPSTGRDVPCATDKQCIATQVCRQGRCIDPASLTCGENGLCPYGHLCQNNRCIVPAQPDCAHCPNGMTCDAATNACVAAEGECPCPAGFACRAGLCLPSSGPLLDVTGHWYTLNRFDVAAALPGWVNELHSVTGAISDAANGRLGLGSLWDDMVEAIVRQFVPEWALSVAGLLDGLLDLFSSLRVSGEMTLTAAGASGTLVGAETWTSLRMSLPSACRGSTPSPQNPCDTVELPIEDQQSLSGRFRAQPFTGRAAGTSRDDVTLLVDPREVDLQLGGLVKLMLDIGIEATTNGRYHSLEDRPCKAGERPARDHCGPGSGVLGGLIDCNALAASIGFPSGADLCRGLVQSAANRVAAAIAKVSVTTEIMRYRGQASATSANGDSDLKATYLGHDDFLTRPDPDGRWRGRYLFVSDVPGRWRAARSPLTWPTP